LQFIKVNKKTPNYFILEVGISSQLTFSTRLRTIKQVPMMNFDTTNLELEHNQLANWME
jgi:hypothetical protein